MTRMIAMFMAVLMNCLVGGTIAVAAGLPSMTGVVGMNVLAAVIGQATPAGVLRAGVYKEIWTGELVKYLRRGLEATFLDGIPDSSSIVNNDVIHLVEVGIDPDVLINNTTYPIPLQALDDKDIAIKLDKFQTKVTPVTDDELYALSYDKMTRVKESHGNAISDSKFAKAAHALCAKEDTATTPVLKTTGKRDPVTGRLKMTVTDLLNLKRALDKLKVPTQGRRLVLCSDHANDLLEASQVFKEQYNINRNDGTIGRLYGFDIYEFANNPLPARKRMSVPVRRPVSSNAPSPSMCRVFSRLPVRQRCTIARHRPIRRTSAHSSTSATTSSACRKRLMPVL